MVIGFLDIPSARPLDPGNRRMSILTAMDFICYWQPPREKYLESMTFKRRGIKFMLSNIVEKCAWKPMSWNDVCTAARGLLDYFEKEKGEKYVETAFVVRRKQKFVRTGSMYLDSRRVGEGGNDSEVATRLGKRQEGPVDVGDMARVTQE